MRRNILLALLALLVVVAVLSGYALLAGHTPSETATPPAATVAAGPSPEGAGTGTQTALQGVERIVILHTNDLHGAIEPDVESGGRESGGLVNLVSLIDELSAQDPQRTLVLDAGDSMQGTYVSNSTQGQVVVAAMNLAGYDAWALGNHEFDWGQDLLRARIEQAEFPALAANLLDAATGRVWDAALPYVILQAGRARVAVLGLAYPGTPAITRAGSVTGLDFRGGAETVSRYLAELEQQSDLVVVLSHLGYEGDEALARALEPAGAVDVIVGGHTHLFLEEPQRINGALILQAGARGQALGRLELSVDLGTGDVTEVDYELLNVSNQVARSHPEARALVDKALADAAETMNQAIGETTRALEPRRAGEFALGNLIVDAMLEAARRNGRAADIAMHNNGGIRAGLPKGAVTYGQLYEVLPFDNHLATLNLTGRQVQQILEQSVAERAGQIQVAGLAFRFSSTRPVGQRVLEVTVGGEALDPARVYGVVTIDYLATGGDGLSTFLEGTDLWYGEEVVTAVAEYIHDRSPVDPKVEGRIHGP